MALPRCKLQMDDSPERNTASPPRCKECKYDQGQVASRNHTPPSLDITLFAAQSLDAGVLAFFDPNIPRSAHVAVPLADIAPQRCYPATSQTLREIAQSLPASGLVSRLDVVLWPETVDRPIQERNNV